MAASDRFTINVRGKGGHGANPQGTVDAIVEAGALVSALQTVVSRNKVCESFCCHLHKIYVVLQGDLSFLTSHCLLLP